MLVCGPLFIRMGSKGRLIKISRVIMLALGLGRRGQFGECLPSMEQFLKHSKKNPITAFTPPEAELHIYRALSGTHFAKGQTRFLI